MAAEPPRLSVLVNRTGTWSLPEELLRGGVLAALHTEGVEEAEFSLTFLDDGEIRTLNQQYLGLDRTTDVIAFSLHDRGDPILGDVYVGYEQAQRQSREASVPLDEELTRLAIHGTLHVLGYRHPEGEERLESEMFQRQEEILRQILTQGEGRGS
jgi:probable rRNA maturation factor